MKRIVMNLIGILAQGIAIVMLFIPGMFKCEVFNKVGFLIDSHSENFFVTLDNGPGAWGYLIILLMIFNIILLLLEILIPQQALKRFDKNDLIFRITAISIPAVTSILLFVFLFACEGFRERGKGYFDFSGVQWCKDTLFYIEIFIMFSIILLSVLKFIGPFRETRSESMNRGKQINIDESDSIRKLKEYKYMLDEGLISENDYERFKISVLNQDATAEWKAVPSYEDELPDL